MTKIFALAEGIPQKQGLQQKIEKYVEEQNEDLQKAFHKNKDCNLKGIPFIVVMFFLFPNPATKNTGTFPESCIPNHYKGRTMSWLRNHYLAFGKGALIQV